MQFSDIVTPNHTAFSANSLRQFDAATPNQDREVGNALNLRSQTDLPQIETTRAATGQNPQPAAPTSRSEVSESKTQAISTKDSLAALKMRAKESVMAKRARSTRSASNDSKTGATNALVEDLTQNGACDNVVQSEGVDLKSCLSNTALHAPSNQLSCPSVEVHRSLAKATSVELEDLLAEGRAAACLAQTINKRNPTTTEQPGLHRGLELAYEQDVSEAGELRDHSSFREQEASKHQSPMTTQHFPADEIDEIDMWLAMTGYYDKPYRNKVLSRRKRLKEIEEEKLRLLEEEEEDQRLRSQFHSTTPFAASQRPNPLPGTKCAPSSMAKQDVGLRIKDFALKTTTMPEKATSNGNAQLKRGIEDDTAAIEAQHQPKAARIQIHRRTPPRSQRVSPERHPNRSVSPGNNRKHPIAPPRRQSLHSRDESDRWLPDRELDHRGPNDRSVEEYAARHDYPGRHDRRRDSGFSTSDIFKPDLGAGRVRFFLLKSWNYENIAAAQKESTWATQTKNEDPFVEAFKTCRHVIFFFSANHSKAFQGYARMQGLPGERGVAQPSWVKNLHWPTTAPFRLRWIVREETPYRAVGNLKNPLNENLAVFVGRDGQEIPEKLGLQLCDILDEDTAYRAEFRR